MIRKTKSVKMTAALAAFSIFISPSHSSTGDKSEALRCFGAHNEISKAYQSLSNKEEKVEFITFTLKAWGLNEEGKQFKELLVGKSLPESRYDGYFKAMLTESTSQCLEHASKE